MPSSTALCALDFSADLMVALELQRWRCLSAGLHGRDEAKEGKALELFRFEQLLHVCTYVAGWAQS